MNVHGHASGIITSIIEGNNRIGRVRSDLALVSDIYEILCVGSGSHFTVSLNGGRKSVAKDDDEWVGGVLPVRGRIFQSLVMFARRGRGELRRRLV